MERACALQDSAGLHALIGWHRRRARVVAWCPMVCACAVWVGLVLHWYWGVMLRGRGTEFGCELHLVVGVGGTSPILGQPHDHALDIRPIHRDDHRSARCGITRLYFTQKGVEGVPPPRGHPLK